MQTGVARRQIDLDEYREQLAFRQGMGEQVRYYIMNQARACPTKKRIVFAEGEESKIIRGAAQVLDEGIGTPVLIGKPEVIEEKIRALGLDCCLQTVDPENFERHAAYAQAYYELRRRKGNHAQRRR